jgi:hypothetical protein
MAAKLGLPPGKKQLLAVKVYPDHRNRDLYKPSSPLFQMDFLYRARDS